MITRENLNASITALEPMRVVFRKCVFKDPNCPCNKNIQETFKFLREWSACMGLNPAELIEVGIPVMEDDHLASYTCCLEYVLPEIDENAPVSLGELPGGSYAVLRVEDSERRIEQAVWQFRSVYMPEHQLTQDARRPVYEIFHGGELDYCVPLSR